MDERGTAGARLERILYLLPLASRDSGVPLAEAAERLGVEVQTIQRDIEEVTSRAFYHPAGGADDMQILLEAERLKIYSHRKFDRPVKLSRREMLSLALGLRAAAVEVSPDEAGRIRDLAHRIEMELAVTGVDEAPELYALDEGDDGGAAFRSRLREAVRARRRCRIRYVKPDDREPRDRDMDPYAVVYATGGWYVVGHCHLRKDIRVFRVDRLLAVTILDPVFEAPETFEPAEYITGGRLFRSEAAEEVSVRYSARVAPWVREHGPVEELEDGSVRVRFPAADTGWVVRHALAYGADAEVEEPPGVREMVVAATRAAARPWITGPGAPAGPRQPD